MSRELILNHPDVRKYTTIWMDTLRNGASELVNTNKLIRHYPGATGLKTGSTSTAMYCVSATAERDGMELIAVVLKSPTGDQRVADARTLLDHGFAGYALQAAVPDEALPPIPVTLGTQATVQPVPSDEKLLLEKTKLASLTKTVELAERVEAPVSAGDVLGTLRLTAGDEVLAEVPITAGESVPRLTWGQVALRLLRSALFAA
jgi:D-alanyl-D-alanine carboxypeptidase (penicillin-binding protein 5/6)